jgi:chromosome segregation ATPase
MLRQEPLPPPPLNGPEDLQAACAWLERERRRLEAYTGAQLARLEAAHREMVAQTYFKEQALLLRCQEVSQQEEVLAQRGRGLQQQAAALAERERALAGQLDQWWRAHEELAAAQEASVNFRQEAELQRALVEGLRAETTALQQSREAAQRDLQALRAALQEQRAARARAEALLADRQAQLERRMRELDQVEEAAQRRLAEVDELEARLRQELEAEETRLARERRELAALAVRPGAATSLRGDVERRPRAAPG